MSTHNLCFGAKIRKIGIPTIPQFCYIKVGFKGVCITRTCFRDVNIHDNYNLQCTAYGVSYNEFL